MRLGDAKIRQQESDGLGGHGRAARGIEASTIKARQQKGSSVRLSIRNRVDFIV
jgi:hypothetical protein